MIYQQQQTFEEFRQVRFIQMEENENGETEVISTTDQRFTPREVLGGAYAIPGAPKPFLIEDDGQIIERVIHHINTRFSATIDVYFQEVYTDMIAEGIPQNLNHYIGKNVRVQFYSNGVLESVQMPTGTITINSEMDEVWRFAFDHFFTNEQVENDDTMVFKMEYETNNIPSLGYDGTLNVHHDTLTRDEAFLELFCDVCNTHFDGHDATAVDNHERCEEHAGNGNQSVAQNASDPDASFDNDNDSDSDSEEEEETDSEAEIEEEAEGEAEAGEAEEEETHGRINEQYNDVVFHANSEIIPIQTIGRVFNFNDIHDFNNTNLPNYTGHGLIGEPVMGQ